MGTKKKIMWIAIAVAVIVAAAGVIILLNMNRQDKYRVIKVYEVCGKATIEREGIGEIEAYENMVLESGDRVSMDSGTMTMQLDEDKYVYVEEGTLLQLVASGTAENSKTTIQLEQGAITNEIQNKLSKDSSYEVNTPNATMSVRGTIFHVNVYRGEDGLLYTSVTVLEGIVATNLIYADGSKADSSKLLSVDFGNMVIIYEDATTTDYLEGIRPLDYNALPDDMKDKIKNVWNMQFGSDDQQKEKDDTQVEEEAEGPFTVTFMYRGTEFGRQVVGKGETASIPSLMPEAEGDWKFDFTTPIMEDTTIEWE